MQALDADAWIGVYCTHIWFPFGYMGPSQTCPTSECGADGSINNIQFAKADGEEDYGNTMRCDKSELANPLPEAKSYTNLRKCEEPLIVDVVQ